MQINKTDIQKIEKIISEGYFFSDNQIEWENIVESIHQLESIDVQSFDRILGQMGDVHLRLYEKPCLKMRICPFWIYNSILYCTNGINRDRIIKLGNYEYEDLIELYSGFYRNYPKPVIASRILHDYQMMNDPFDYEGSYETKQGRFDAGVIIIEKSIQTNVSRKPKYIYMKKTDDDTLQIRIFALNSLEIIQQMRESFCLFDPQEIKNIIFDIRDNQGGSIDVACKVMETILPGTFEYSYWIVDSSGKRERRVIYGRNELGLGSVQNIFIFVNENTASSSEFIIIEGLLKALGDRVKIIGRATQGTTGQAAVLKINDGIFLNMTIKRLFDENGTELKLSYEPDYEVNSFSTSVMEDDFINMYNEIKREQLQ